MVLAEGLPLDGEPCALPAGCGCSHHTMDCTNITVFPIFEQLIKAGIQHIQLHETTLVDLHPFLERDWPRLQQLIFQNNNFLACDIIESLHRNELKIYSDCITTTVNTPTTVEPTAETSLVLLLLGGILFMLTIGALISVCGNQSRNHQSEREVIQAYGHTGVEETTSDIADTSSRP